MTNGFIKYYSHSIMVICLLGSWNICITFLLNSYNSSFQYTKCKEIPFSQQGINRMSMLMLQWFPKSSISNLFLYLPISSERDGSPGTAAFRSNISKPASESSFYNMVASCWSVQLSSFVEMSCNTLLTIPSEGKKWPFHQNVCI